MNSDFGVDPALFDLPAPHLWAVEVPAEAIDNYGHVNNTVYITWLDQCAWDHSRAVGLTKEDCDGLDRGMAVLRSQFNYLRPAFEGDTVVTATWIIENDGRLRCTRRFQIVRPSDGATLLRGRIDFFCLEISTGRPTRLPPLFMERYGVIPEVAEAMAREPLAFMPGLDQKLVKRLDADLR
ncbi:MAG: thioesterase family protein [Pseudomonadota bacterium]